MNFRWPSAPDAPSDEVVERLVNYKLENEAGALIFPRAILVPYSWTLYPLILTSPLFHAGCSRTLCCHRETAHDQVVLHWCCVHRTSTDLSRYK